MTDPAVEEVQPDTPPPPPARWHTDLREIFVIALGIMLAFGVDAWWGELQEGRDVERALAAVGEEIRTNVDQMRGSMDLHRQIADAGLELLSLSGPRADIPAPDRVYDLLGTIWLYPTPRYNSGALTTLIASGNLARVESSALRTRLAGWPDQLADVEDFEEESRLFLQSELRPAFWRHLPQLEIELRSGFVFVPELGQRFRGAIPDESRFRSDPTALLRDVDFQNRLVQRTTQAMISGVMLGGVVEDGEDLANQILGVND